VLGAVAVSYPVAKQSSQCRGILGAILDFDLGGVLVDSPHDLAWREALQELREGDRRYIDDTTTYLPDRSRRPFCQEVMASKPPLGGARAPLEYVEGLEAGSREQRYAAVKDRGAGRSVRKRDERLMPDVGAITCDSRAWPRLL
jgi:beta-phosphoglucomutase